MYKVEGYDKDNDVYVEYWKGTDLEKAKEISIILDNIALNDKLIRYCNDGSKEPIDWVHIVNDKEEIVYLPRAEK